MCILPLLAFFVQHCIFEIYTCYTCRFSSIISITRNYSIEWMFHSLFIHLLLMVIQVVSNYIIPTNNVTTLTHPNVSYSTYQFLWKSRMEIKWLYPQAMDIVSFTSYFQTFSPWLYRETHRPCMSLYDGSPCSTFLLIQQISWTLSVQWVGSVSHCDFNLHLRVY